MERYNVLWLLCEDVSPWMECYGDDTIKTPKIDALGKEGVTYTNCFSPAPVCSPARSGIITGCMPTTIGVHHHVMSRLEEPTYFLPEEIKTIPEIMKKEGYFTFNHGKDDYNFTYNRKDLYSGEYHTIKFYGDHGNPISWRERPNKEMPFFGQFTLWGGKNPHQPKTTVSQDAIKVAPYYPDTETFQKKYERHYNQILRTDEEVGTIVDALKKDGEYENTIIVFMSDHGYELLRAKQFLYDGGIHIPFTIRLPKQLRNLVKENVNEALVSSIDVTATTLALCGIEIPKYMESKNVFAPDYHHDYIISARDRCDFTIDRIRSVRTKQFKYIKNFLTDRMLMQSQYREKSDTFIESFQMKEQGLLNDVQLLHLSEERIPEELYDVIQDPHEIHNLANNPEYKEVLQEMRQILEKFIEDTDDKGQYPETLEEYVALVNRWGMERCKNPEYKEAKEYVKTFGSWPNAKLEDYFNNTNVNTKG